jgi:carbonic anhydrase
MPGPFDDLLEANRRNQADFAFGELTGRPRRGLAVLTCVDTRIDPLSVLGLEPGDAKILRNAGARVTDDVVRSLALVVAALGVERVAVIAHTDCAAAKATDDELRAMVAEVSGADTSRWAPLATGDQRATLRADLARLEQEPMLPGDLVVGAFLYDVTTGALEALDWDQDTCLSSPSQ